MSKIGYVYIMANHPKGTLYIGVTSNLEKRVFEHRNKIADGFTRRYDLTRLVYCEEAPDMESAINREKQLKNWHREWKMNLIQQQNPKWLDLAADWFMSPETNEM